VRWRKVADFNDCVKKAWEGCQATYKRAVDEWRGRCNELLSQGTMKKNLQYHQSQLECSRKM